MTWWGKWQNLQPLRLSSHLSASFSEFKCVLVVNVQHGVFGVHSYSTRPVTYKSNKRQHGQLIGKQHLTAATSTGYTDKQTLSCLHCRSCAWSIRDGAKGRPFLRRLGLAQNHKASGLTAQWIGNDASKNIDDRRENGTCNKVVRENKKPPTTCWDTDRYAEEY